MDSYPYLLCCSCEHCEARHPTYRGIFGAYYLAIIGHAIGLIGVALAVRHG